MITTHPKVTTTTTPANNVYVPPTRISFRADPYVVVSPPRAGHTFTQDFHNVEIRIAAANNVNMTPPMVGHVPKSAITDAYASPPQPNKVMYPIPVTPNPVTSQVPISVSYNSFVPLSHPKIREVVPEQPCQSSSVRVEVPMHQNQIGPIGNPSQGALLADPSLRIARPGSVSKTTRANVILGPPVTVSQMPPTTNFIPEAPRAKSQATPTNSSIPPNSGPWYQVPRFEAPGCLVSDASPLEH
jgi:hypothetical protein